MSKILKETDILNKRLWRLMKDSGKETALELAKGIYDKIDWYNKEEVYRSKNLQSASKLIIRHLKGQDITGEYLKAYCEYFGCSADYILGIIEMPTHSLTDIHKETGLSEKSINALSENPNRDIIDAFISSDEFLELGEYPLHYAEMHFNSFRRYAEQYIKLSEQYKNLNEDDYKAKEIICKHSDKALQNMEVFASYIKSFCIDELFLFQKFLREYKNKLATKYEYEKYMDIINKQ